MNMIIQQILSNAAKKFINYYEENGIKEIGFMADEVKSISDAMAKEILIAYIENADKTICEAKAERKADGIKIHEKNVPRTIYTSLGELTYMRTYFEIQEGRSYLLDVLLGVCAYERIDSGVSAKLVNHAATHSYGHSTKAECAKQSDEHGRSRLCSRESTRNAGKPPYLC